MIVYRVTKDKYIEDLSGHGAKVYGGRWNKEGSSMLYTSSNLSLCVLELLANQVWGLIYKGYSYISIELPDSVSLARIDANKLSVDWRKSEYHQQTVILGTSWLKQNDQLALLVPSAVLPDEYNILINPLHSEFQYLKKKRIASLRLDHRVIKEVD